MTVLHVRTSKRYAARRALPVTTENGFKAVGLLIEISADGCRISNLGKAQLTVGDRIDAELDDIRLDGSVRWSDNGVVGLRFERPLHTMQLGQLISAQKAYDGQLLGNVIAA